MTARRFTEWLFIPDDPCDRYWRVWLSLRQLGCILLLFAPGLAALLCGLHGLAAWLILMGVAGVSIIFQTLWRWYVLNPRLPTERSDDERLRDDIRRFEVHQDNRARLGLIPPLAERQRRANPPS